MDRYDFASDNCSGICPEAWEAMEKANTGFVASYGDDAWTKEAADAIRDLFGSDCEMFFTFTGTAANSLAIASLCQSYHSVICHTFAHVETDECGGPEFFTHGTKVLLAGGAHGKLDPEAVEKLVTARDDLHFPKPRVLSLTQSTELGTVYTVDELETLRGVAKRHGLKVHMDGARLANAAEFLGVSPAELTWKRGVDVLSLGGVKDGLMMGEAVVFFDHALAAEFEFRCKQAGQLASKMRFIAAGWAGMLRSGAWSRNAEHANACAKTLEAELKKIGIGTVSPVEANAVFAKFTPETVQALRAKGWHFYGFIGTGGSRLMCSWATTPGTVEAFVADVKAVSGRS
jgi:threonine aldolase